ncbi:MAG: hypothetical protein ACKOWO_05520 [Sediminibacterium sp.]
MNKNFLSLFLLWAAVAQAQISKNQFSFSGVYGLILSNNIHQTSMNYDWYPSTSGVNLKCAAINGLQLQYQHFIQESKWFASANYERRWLNYTNTLYSAKFDPNTVYNYTKNIELKTQIETFSLGAGRRFVLPKTRFSFDLSAGLSYNFFADKKLSTKSPSLGYGYPAALYLTESLPTGDFLYYVELDYSYYAKLMYFNALASIKYRLNTKLDLQFNLSMANWLKGEYSFETITKGPDYVVDGVIFNSKHINTYNNLGNVHTRYLNLGLGLNYKF